MVNATIPVHHSTTEDINLQYDIDGEIIRSRIDALVDEMSIKYNEEHPGFYALPVEKVLAKEAEFRKEARRQLLNHKEKDRY